MMDSFVTGFSYITFAPGYVRVIVSFAATGLGTLTLIASGAWILFRQLPTEGVFSPLKHFVQRLRELSFILVTLIVTLFCAIFLKELFGVERPEIVNPLFELKDYAFPSGHASLYAALATAVFFIRHEVGYLLGGVTLLIGLARILAGVHTVLDIVGGIILGVLIASIIHLISEKIHS